MSLEDAATVLQYYEHTTPTTEGSKLLVELATTVVKTHLEKLKTNVQSKESH